MEELLPVPESLRPRIGGVEKLLEILGPEYDFHDSEVEEINIKENGEVRIRIWSSWATNQEGQLITEWNLHNCVRIDYCGHDPNVCWLNQLWLEKDQQWIKMVLLGVGATFMCEGIDVIIKPFDGKRGRVYIDMDNVLVDFESGIQKVDEATQKEYEGRLDEVPGIFSQMNPMPGAISAVKKLAKKYDVYILSTSPWNNPSAWADKVAWVTKYLGDVMCKRLILSHHKNLLKGDFLVDDRTKNGAHEFEGKLIRFGSEQFPDWEEVLDYLMERSRSL